MHNTLNPAPHTHLTPTVPPSPMRTIHNTLFQYTRPRSLHQLLRDTPYNTDWSLIPHFLLQCGIVNAVIYNLYSWRWAYKCSKYVELIYENKLHWLHQVGSSRLWYTRWFKYDRDLWGLFTQKTVPFIFEPPCICLFHLFLFLRGNNIKNF
jgi:hypothetical protein